MKLKIWKYIYDTDEGTGCDLYSDEAKAKSVYLAKLKSEYGYTGPDDYEAAHDWVENEGLGIDTIFIEADEVEIPEPEVSSLIAEIRALKAENYWNEHEMFPRLSWRNAVEEEDTTLGYWDWCEHQSENLESCACCGKDIFICFNGPNDTLVCRSCHDNGQH